MMGKEGGVGFKVEVWTEKLDFYFNVALLYHIGSLLAIRN